MSFQQLDLFGNPILPQLAKTTSKKAVAMLIDADVQTTEKKEEEVIVIVEKKQIEIVEDIVAAKSKRGRPRKLKIENLKFKQTGKRGRKSYAETYADTNLTTIPDDEKLKEKLYYAISEVAGWFNLSTSQLRFWENEFDILQPRKNRKGDRLFRPEDIHNLKTIYYLLRTKKLSIESAKDYLKANKHKTELQVQLQSSLQNFKAFLLELKANL